MYRSVLVLFAFGAALSGCKGSASKTSVANSNTTDTTAVVAAGAGTTSTSDTASTAAGPATAQSPGATSAPSGVPVSTTQPGAPGSGGGPAGSAEPRNTAVANATAAGSGANGTATGPVTNATAAGPTGVNRAPNEMGRIMVLEYHLIGDRNSTYSRERGQFRKDLELLYDRGYRPVNMSDVLDKKLNLPKGLSPVVFVLDDASPEQFRYIEKNGNLEIDPTSGIGIWLDFQKTHPDWPNKAVFCLLSGAAAGHNFFGDRGVQGQKSAWRFKKVKWLADNGFELCDHTLWHAQLSKYPDAFVQEQIARNAMAIDSAVPGYRIRSMALPQGLWPKNRALATKGSWTDPKTGKTVSYSWPVVFEVTGGPMRSPYDPAFNPGSTPRIQVIGNAIENNINRLERAGNMYVSDGNPAVVARPPAAPTNTATKR